MRVISKSADITIRKMEDSDNDYQLMAKWLSDGRVLKFIYGRKKPQSLSQVKKKYRPRILGKENVVPCIFSFQDREIGYIQFYSAKASEYELSDATGVWALDIWIGEPEYWERGFGPEVLMLVSNYLFKEKTAKKLIIDPHVDNPRAIRAYEKAGYKKVKILKKHELFNGTKVDSWLMEKISA